MPGSEVGRAPCVLVMVMAMALWAGCNLVEAGRAAPGGPNVVLVTVDTLRADHVGSYGYETAETPVLDLLSERGVLFEQAMATAPVTLPSHASILTGLYPTSHGVRHNAVFRLASEHTTVAERFQQAGYRTGAVIGAAVLSRDFGLDQGFDFFDEEMGEDRATASGSHERKADAVTNRALEWLEAGDGPFFLWVHYYDVHATYSPPEPFQSRFRDLPYDGEVAFVDYELGRLLDGLGASLEDTLVAVTSDHGEGLGEHGERTHTYFVYDADIHVPLVIAGPGVPGGRRVEEVVSNAGLAPTLTALAGLPALDPVDVGDLTPLWTARESGSLKGVGWAYAESLAGKIDFGWAPMFAVRDAEHHYIRAPRSELFNLASDPGQNANLFESRDDVARSEPIALAEARLAEVGANETDLDPIDVDAETRAAIEALGYVVPTGQAADTGQDPKDVHQFAGLGHAAMGHLFAGRLDLAERVARRGLEAMPQSGALHDILAHIHMAASEPSKALPHAIEAARLHPHWADFHAQLATVRLTLEDLDGAITSFERVVELDPEHPGGHLGMMWKVRTGGSIEAARAHARRVVELSTDRPDYHEMLGEIWETLGEYDAALAVYREALHRFPQHQDRLHMRLAIQWARFGEHERGEAHRANAGEIGRDPTYLSRYGVALAARGDPGRAEVVFREILRRNPEHVSTKIYLAKLLRETGREAESRGLVAPGTRMRPPMPNMDGIVGSVPRG